MHYLCINLPTSSVRRERMAGQFKALGIEVEWVPGVAGDLLTSREFDELCDLQFQQAVNDRAFMPGEIGCSLSHLSAYRLMLERGLSHAVILEDDVVLDTQLDEIVTTAATMLDQSRPEVLLLNEVKGWFPASRRELRSYRVGEVSSARLAWGYLLNAAAARAILDGNSPVRFLADDWKRLRYYCDCHISAVIPPLVGEQPDLVSDIRGPAFKKPKRRASLQSRLKRIPMKLSRVKQRLFRQVERVEEADRKLVSPVSISQ